MKRSEVISEIKSIIATCGPTQPTILTAEQVLNKVEALGFQRVEESDDYCFTLAYEPEEGWDTWLLEEKKKDTARDFTVTLTSAQKENKTPLYRSQAVAQEFLDGKSFEELAKQYNVTRERIRQIVHKERRRFQLKEEGKLP